MHRACDQAESRDSLDMQPAAEMDHSDTTSVQPCRVVLQIRRHV
jgi:hypothetical protein